MEIEPQAETDSPNTIQVLGESQGPAVAYVLPHRACYPVCGENTGEGLHNILT